MTTRTFGPYDIELSRLDKVLFPDDGITKGDLVGYYERIAPTMLPHLADRPLSLQRFPDGIDEDGFFTKDEPDHFPAWIETVNAPKQDGRVSYVVASNTATLVYLANQACITPHVFLSRRSALHHPDRMAFDLDPPGDDFEPVRELAKQLHDLLEELELAVFLQTTGSRGVHLVCPLRAETTFEEVRKFARDVAEVLVARQPERATLEQRKSKRGRRVFVDVGRNAYGQTMVSPYAVRARAGAPVATPIDREELGRSEMHPRRYDWRSVLRRLAQRDDPWRDIGRRARSLDTPRRKLLALKKS